VEQDDQTLPEAVLRLEALLAEENSRQNLCSRATTPEDLRRRLVRPCWRFAQLPVVAVAERVADLGTGGGLPGLLVALARPERPVHLVDSTLKKCRFLERAAAELGLPTVTVHHERIENLNLEPLPDLFCARFVADLATLERWTRRLRRPGSRLLVFKGEHEAAPARLRDLRLADRHPLDDDKQVLDYVCDPL